MRHAFALGVVGLFLLSSSTVFAQSAGSPWWSSTLAEGAQRGRASIIEAEGTYNLNTAQAMIAAEKARGLAYENDKIGIQEWFQRQEINRQYRSSARGPRPTMEDLARRAKDAAPERLTRYQLDPVFGTISWPPALRGPEFAEARAIVEKNFRERDVVNSGIGSPVQRAVAQSADLMEAQLKGMLDELSPVEYVQTKRFLQSLAFEAEFVPQVQGVALISP